MVVLLVIFLPMLLEEDPTSPVSKEELTIPPRPDFDQGYDASVADGPVESSEPAMRETEERVSQAPPAPQELPPSTLIEAPATGETEIPPEFAIVPDREAESEPQPQPEAEPQPQPDQAEQVSPAAEQAPETEAASTSEPGSGQSSEPEPPPSGVSSWVLQVSSLREPNRARKLRLDLRAKGFPAFIADAQVGGKLWYRVLIGPEIERERIESMAASLKEKMDLKGDIKRFP
jgi:DedD protein